MKKTLTLALFTLATAIGFADDKHDSYFYMKMGLFDAQPAHSAFIPGLGLGYRVLSDASALDISSSFHAKKHNCKYNLARVNYLRYLSPNDQNSLYLGGGLAWGGVKTRDQRSFQGLIPGINIGYELNRMSRLHGFAELDVAQPLISVASRHGLPGPSVELNVGAGF